MKQAIWKVDPFGNFKFRGGQLGQLTLGESVIVDFDLLEGALQERFRGKEWQNIENVEELREVRRDGFSFKPPQGEDSEAHGGYRKDRSQGEYTEAVRYVPQWNRAPIHLGSCPDYIQAYR